MITERAAEKVLNLGWDGHIPVNLDTLVQHINIKNNHGENCRIKTRYDFAGELRGNSARSFLYQQGNDKFYICETDIEFLKEYQNFSIAHALGHVVLRHIPEKGILVDKSFPVNPKLDIDRQANNFALAILMPKDVFIREYFAFFKKISTLFLKKSSKMKRFKKNMSHLFCVSELAVIIRAKQLHLDCFM